MYPDRAGGLIVASSANPDPVAAVAELAGRIGPEPLAGAVLFCSHHYDREKLETALTESFGDFPIIGCTSGGELSERGYDEGSVVLICFPAHSFVMETQQFGDLDVFEAKAGMERTRRLAEKARWAARKRFGWATMHTAALFLVDSMPGCEDLLTSSIQKALGETVMVGGWSGGGGDLAERWVLYDRKFYKNVAVLAVLYSTRRLHVFTAHPYCPTGEKMVITATDPDQRSVLEINALPALDEYRRIVGQPDAVVDAAFVAAHPVMMRVGGKYQIRSIKSANPDKSITFFSDIDTGSVLTVGEPSERIGHLRETLRQVKAVVGEIDHIIGFDCILNRIDVEARQAAKKVSEFYAENRVVGFNTFGEQCRATHLNQTLCGLAVGR